MASRESLEVDFICAVLPLLTLDFELDSTILKKTPLTKLRQAVRVALLRFSRIAKEYNTADEKNTTYLSAVGPHYSNLSDKNKYTSDGKAIPIYKDYAAQFESLTREEFHSIRNILSIVWGRIWFSNNNIIQTWFSSRDVDIQQTLDMAFFKSGWTGGPFSIIDGGDLVVLQIMVGIMLLRKYYSLAKDNNKQLRGCRKLDIMALSNYLFSQKKFRLTNSTQNNFIDSIRDPCVRATVYLRIYLSSMVRKEKVDVTDPDLTQPLQITDVMDIFQHLQPILYDVLQNVKQGSVFQDMNSSALLLFIALVQRNQLSKHTVEYFASDVASKSTEEVRNLFIHYGWFKRGTDTKEVRQPVLGRRKGLSPGFLYAGGLIPAHFSRGAGWDDKLWNKYFPSKVSATGAQEDTTADGVQWALLLITLLKT